MTSCKMCGRTQPCNCYASSAPRDTAQTLEPGKPYTGLTATMFAAADLHAQVAAKTQRNAAYGDELQTAHAAVERAVSTAYDMGRTYRRVVQQERAELEAETARLHAFAEKIYGLNPSVFTSAHGITGPAFVLAILRDLESLARSSFEPKPAPPPLSRQHRAGELTERVISTCGNLGERQEMAQLRNATDDVYVARLAVMLRKVFRKAAVVDAVADKVRCV